MNLQFGSAEMRPLSWPRLALQGYVSLLVCVALGSLASAPIFVSQVVFFAEATYLVGARPADDSRLQAWAMTQPNVVSFTTERRGDDLWVRSEYGRSLSQRPTSRELLDEMRRQGYEFRGMRGGAQGMSSGVWEIFAQASSLAATLAAMQAAFGCVGLYRIHASNRRHGDSPRSLIPAGSGKALVVGLFGGLGLLVLGVVNSYLLTALFGHAPPSPWDASKVMTAPAKAVFLLFGGLGAPIAEEIFFRGYLFREWKRAGYIGLGLAYSSILFGVVHFSDAYNVPVICLFGVCLAWIYHRTGSLLAPIAAHAVNNSVAILWMLSS